MASEKESNGSRKVKKVVKLPLSALQFLSECPRCRFEEPIDGTVGSPFPRIFDRLEGGRIRAGDEKPNDIS